MQTYTINPIGLATKFDLECNYRCFCGKQPHLKAMVEIDEQFYWHYFCRKCLAMKLEDEPEFHAAWSATLSIMALSTGIDFIDDGDDVTIEMINKVRETQGQPPFEPMRRMGAGVYMVLNEVSR